MTADLDAIGTLCEYGTLLIPGLALVGGARSFRLTSPIQGQRHRYTA